MDCTFVFSTVSGPHIQSERSLQVHIPCYAAATPQHKMRQFGCVSHSILGPHRKKVHGFWPHIPCHIEKENGWWLPCHMGPHNTETVDSGFLSPAHPKKSADCGYMSPAVSGLHPTKARRSCIHMTDYMGATPPKCGPLWPSFLCRQCSSGLHQNSFAWVIANESNRVPLRSRYQM